MLVLRKFARDTSGMVGLGIGLVTAVVAALAPRLAPHPLEAYESHPIQRLQEPRPRGEIVDLEAARAVEPGRAVSQLELEQLIVGVVRRSRHGHANTPDVVSA